MTEAGRVLLNDYLFLTIMMQFSEEWPLPGQVDPDITPCAFCRRRLHVNGGPIFITCSCKTMGPSVTIGALAVGAVALVAAAVWALSRNK
jgi:hypothetical protein